MEPISSKNSVPVSLNKQPSVLTSRFSESPSSVSEQLALKEGLRHGSTVYGYKRSGTATTAVVKLFGNEFLSGPCLSGDEH